MAKTTVKDLAADLNLPAPVGHGCFCTLVQCKD